MIATDDCSRIYSSTWSAADAIPYAPSVPWKMRKAVRRAGLCPKREWNMPLVRVVQTPWRSWISIKASGGQRIQALKYTSVLIEMRAEGAGRARQTSAFKVTKDHVSVERNCDALHD